MPRLHLSILCYCHSDPRHLHVLTHTFPTRPTSHPGTSHHHRLALPAGAMWFGTLSTTTERPCSAIVSTRRPKPAAPPRSSLSCPWSTTSYPWVLPGTACRIGEQ